MVFSSKVFLFYFLPIVLIGYYLLKRNRKASNLFLTLMSLLFYAWGEPKFVFVMIASIAANWLFGLWVDSMKQKGKSAKPALIASVVFNLALLGVFKYLRNARTHVSSLSLRRLMIRETTCRLCYRFPE